MLKQIINTGYNQRAVGYVLTSLPYEWLHTKLTLNFCGSVCRFHEK